MFFVIVGENMPFLLFDAKSVEDARAKLQVGLKPGAVNNVEIKLLTLEALTIKIQEEGGEASLIFNAEF